MVALVEEKAVRHLGQGVNDRRSQSHDKHCALNHNFSEDLSRSREELEASPYGSRVSIFCTITLNSMA